mgnify:CR=1 FL=1
MENNRRIIWEEVFERDYMLLILFGVIRSCILLGDFINSRFDTIKVNKHYLTIYRGVFEGFVYINGKEKERLWSNNYANVIETKLPDSVKFIITFSI